MSKKATAGSLRDALADFDDDTPITFIAWGDDFTRFLVTGDGCLYLDR